MRLTQRGWNVLLGAVLLVWAIAVLIMIGYNGDPCDSTPYPDRCRVEVPER